MAEKKKTVASEESKAQKTTKKVATGSTKKMVEKRSSSVASKKGNTTTKSTTTKKGSTKTGEIAPKKPTQKKTATKTTTKKEASAKTTTKKATSKKENNKDEVSNSKTKTSKSATKTPKKANNKIDVFEEETKEVFSSLLKVTGQKIQTEEGEKKTRNKEKVVNDQETKQIEGQKEKDEKRLSIKEMAQIQEAVKKEMKQNKKMPELELKRMTTRIFRNIFLAIVVMAYFNFIILGFVNIENNIFITDLKVFSGIILVIAIGVMEYAFRKRSGRHAIHSIEFLVLALITIALIYVNLTWEGKFIPITVLITYVFSIYYMIKAVVIYRRMKKEYFMESMKAMIRK